MDTIKLKPGLNHRKHDEILAQLPEFKKYSTVLGDRFESIPNTTYGLLIFTCEIFGPISHRIKVQAEDSRLLNALRNSVVFAIGAANKTNPRLSRDFLAFICNPTDFTTVGDEHVKLTRGLILVLDRINPGIASIIIQMFLETGGFEDRPYDISAVKASLDMRNLIHEMYE